MCWTDTNFANIIKEAEMVIPDGIGVKIALKLTGKNADRIPGVDFAKRLLKEAALSNIPVAIVGSKEEVVAKAVENLQKEISALNIVYYHNGYFDNDDEIIIIDINFDEGIINLEYLCDSLNYNYLSYSNDVKEKLSIFISYVIKKIS